MLRSNFSAQIVASSDTRTSWALMRMRSSDRSTDPTSRKSECSWRPVSRRSRGSRLERERRGAGADLEAADHRQLADDFIGQAVGHLAAVRIGSEIRQRQHGDRWRVGFRPEHGDGRAADNQDGCRRDDREPSAPRRRARRRPCAAPAGCRIARRAWRTRRRGLPRRRSAWPAMDRSRGRSPSRPRRAGRGTCARSDTRLPAACAARTSSSVRPSTGYRPVASRNSRTPRL